MERRGSCASCNNKMCKIQGMCIIHLKIFDEQDFLLKNVRYIPELKTRALGTNTRSLYICDVFSDSKRGKIRILQPT
jgi:hypothetical protein